MAFVPEWALEAELARRNRIDWTLASVPLQKRIDLARMLD
jgi:hypothetical protein